MSSSLYRYQQSQRPTVSKPEVIAGPTTEPLTIQEARRHLFLAADDQEHDQALESMIQEAREQWENDTDSTVMAQTLRVTAEGLFGREVCLPSRPIQSIESFTYYDLNDVSQTMPSSIYSLDKSRREIRLDWNETWPAMALRWDAATIDYVAGVDTREEVAAIAKRAMLLLIGYYFENRDMLANDIIYSGRAYDSLVTKYMRSTYP